MTASATSTSSEPAADPNLFGMWFNDRDTWQVWFAFLATLFALPMTEEQLASTSTTRAAQDPRNPRQARPGSLLVAVAAKA